MTNLDVYRQMGVQFREIVNQIVYSDTEQELRDLGISVTPDPKAPWDPTKRYLKDDECIFNGVVFKALRYNKNESPLNHPHLWEEVPQEIEAIVWANLPEMQTILTYEDKPDIYFHKDAYWKCISQHFKSNVNEPRPGSSRWEEVV